MTDTLAARLRSGVYGINRIALCSEAADALDAQAAELDQWRNMVWALARVLNCLPSTYADANAHVYKAAEKQAAEIAALRDVLSYAEAALADIGDADREPGDDLAWCEARAAEALPRVRAALRKEQEAAK